MGAHQTLLAMKKEITSWADFIDSDYMGAWSLPQGKDVVLTIAGYDNEEVFNPSSKKKEEKITIHFAEKYTWIKKMIAGNANGKILSKITRNKPPIECIGMMVQIGISDITVAGKPIKALRVRDVYPEKIASDYNALMAAIPLCKSRDEINALTKQYVLFMSNREEVRNLCNQKWTELGPTSETAKPE